MDHSSLVSQCDSYIRQLTHMLSMLHQLCIGVSSIQQCIPQFVAPKYINSNALVLLTCSHAKYGPVETYETSCVFRCMLGWLLARRMRLFCLLSPSSYV